jgi:MerR family transcriptional regulator, light-induced transcriptional regulator
MSRDLNLKQAARRLGVHYMTAYRYVRQGKLAATSDGASWRVSEAAVEDFLAEDHGRSARPPGAFREQEQAGRSRGARGARAARVDWALRLARCLLAGDEPAAWRVVQSALASGHSPTFCYVDMLSEALAWIGARGEAGEITVADQHIATAVAARVIARLGATWRRSGRSRGTVVFGAPSGEMHSLPISIAADLVRLAGFGALELGPNVPPDAFAMAATRAPRLVAVGIGVSRAESLDAAQQAVDAVRATDPEVPILLGGQAAISPAAAKLVGVTAWASGGREAVELIEAFARARHGRRHRSRDSGQDQDRDRDREGEGRSDRQECGAGDEHR